MKQYRNKTTGNVFGAVQFTGRNLEEIYSEFGTVGIEALKWDGVEGWDKLALNSRGGYIYAKVGDWVIEDPVVNNSFFSCKPDTFKEMYVEIPDVTEELSTPLPSCVRMKTATHQVSLVVFVDNEDDRLIVGEKLSEMAMAFGQVFPSVWLSQNKLEEDPSSELSGDEPIDAVRSVMLDEGLNPETVNDMISRLLRAGVVFNSGEPIVELFHEDENTMSKVSKALADSGMTAGHVTDAISIMQEAGIVFVERS